MGRSQVDPLRALTDDERMWLTRLSRARTQPAVHVARATALLAVADGATYTDATRVAGRRSGDAVAHLVARFNREGLAAVEPRHGGGHTPVYAETERARILAEARRTPDRATDGTATWSLTTLQRAPARRTGPADWSPRRASAGRCPRGDNGSGCDPASRSSWPCSRSRDRGGLRESREPRRAEARSRRCALPRSARAVAAGASVAAGPRRPHRCNRPGMPPGARHGRGPHGREHAGPGEHLHARAAGSDLTVG